jgi:hypothetical protein
MGGGPSRPARLKLLRRDGLQRSRYTSAHN